VYEKSTPLGEPQSRPTNKRQLSVKERERGVIGGRLPWIAALRKSLTWRNVLIGSLLGAVLVLIPAILLSVGPAWNPAITRILLL
jgi:hypothetical protein